MATDQLLTLSFYETIFDQMPGYVFWKDVNSVYQGCNKQTTQLLGFSSKTEIIGKTDFDLATQLNWGPLVAERLRAQDREIIRLKKPKTTEEVLVKGNGELAVLTVNKTPLIDPHNQTIIGVLGVAIDITEQKRIHQAELKFLEMVSQEIWGKKFDLQIDSQDKFKWFRIFLDIIINQMPGYVYWKNTNCVYMGCNDATVKLIGMHSKEEVIGHTDQDFARKLGWSKAVVDNIQEVDREAMKSGVVKTSEETFVTAAGETITCLTTKTPIRDEEGHSIGVMCIATDITEKRKAEMLLDAKEKAEFANLVKSNFLATMSHELRTPINVILGVIQILTSHNLSGEEKEYISIIQKSCSNLIALINDILDFAKLESGKLSIKYESCDLFQLVESIITNMEHLIENNAIKLMLEWDKKTPRYISIDPNRLRQILVNLIGNAIKFTKKGHVKINIQSKPCTQSTCEVTFTITDTGIGISEDKINCVFERFMQLENRYDRKFGGSGLGLSISKQLVEGMGGTIGATSQLNKGSTFWFTLPIQITEQPYPIPKKLNDELIVDLPLLKSHKILLIEDNILNQRIAKIMLEKLGCIVDVANNGEDGLSLFDTNQYDLILLDLGLPGMNGLEIAKEIRRRETSKKRTPIINLTAHVLDEDRQNCLDAGADEVLTKPILQPQLRDILLKLKS